MDDQQRLDIAAELAARTPDVHLEQDVRTTAAWRRIVDRGTQLTGPERKTLTVERSALRGLVEAAERGCEARRG